MGDRTLSIVRDFEEDVVRLICENAQHCCRSLEGEQSIYELRNVQDGHIGNESVRVLLG